MSQKLNTSPPADTDLKDIVNRYTVNQTAYRVKQEPPVTALEAPIAAARCTIVSKRKELADLSRANGSSCPPAVLADAAAGPVQGAAADDRTPPSGLTDEYTNEEPASAGAVVGFPEPTPGAAVCHTQVGVPVRAHATVRSLWHS